MANYVGPDRREESDRRAETTSPITPRDNEQVKTIIRVVLTISSVVMLAFAGLTFAGITPFPQWISFLFVAVAAIDLCIGYVVFGGKR